MDSTANLFLRFENRTLFAPPQRPFLATTVITGSLGSGKTTLLQHILTNRMQLRVAAAINDFASLNVDANLIRSHNAQTGVTELTNGCVCCSLKSNLKEAAWNVLNGEATTNIDYLVVETSGVTDPYPLIVTLEEKFGKMSRIRLDSVITVVDADDLYGRLTQREAITSTANMQLQCADVILLNKADLIDLEHRPVVENFVREHAPRAQIYWTTNSSVPLEQILDVRAVATANVISHECFPRSFIVSPDGGHLRCENFSVAAMQSSNGHLKDDDYDSVVFEDQRAFSLTALQDLVAKELPQNIARMKGIFRVFEDTLAVSPLYTHNSTFQLSGRNRLEFTRVEQTSSEASSTVSGLVAIGRKLDKSRVMAALQTLIASPEASDTLSSVMTDQRIKTRNIVDADLRFDVLPDFEHLPHVVYFRLTGARINNSTVSELETLYGVRMTDVNRDLCRAVNNSGALVLLTYCAHPLLTDVCALRYAINSRTDFITDVWPVIQREAEKVLKWHLQRFQSCKCGF